MEHHGREVVTCIHALGLLALALLGTEGPAQPVAPEVTYQLHVYEMKGVGWREDVYRRLQPVTRQGNSTLWTTDRTTMRELGKLAETAKMAPKMTALAGTPAHVVLYGTPPNGCTFQELQAQRLHEPVMRTSFDKGGSNPAPERPRFAATFTGRKLDQGVLVKLVLEETRFLAVHSVALDDDNAPLAVPEVATSDLIGEWLIPNDGALVISLGAHTVADDDGKAVVRERLVVLEAQPAADAHMRAVTFSRSEGPLARPRALVAPAPVMPAPAAPSRSLPQARLADGTAIDLPPLPPDDHVTPTSLPNSSEPCASPQTRPAPAPKKTDADASQTSPQPPNPAHPANGTFTLKFRLGSVSLPAAPYEGLTLPSGQYMHDDVKYLAPAPGPLPGLSARKGGGDCPNPRPEGISDTSSWIC